MSLAEVVLVGIKKLSSTIKIEIIMYMSNDKIFVILKNKNSEKIKDLNAMISII